MNRRQFLGNSTRQLALLNLAALTPTGLLAGNRKDTVFTGPETINDKAVLYRTLGRTGIKVPVVSMGVMNASVPNVVRQAYLKGMRFFDTAWFYQNGRNETNDIHLDAEETAFLRQNQVNLAHSFCRHCHECVSSCPNKVDIPNLMRTWMYAFQYRNMEHARLTAKTIAGNNGLNPCVTCAACTAVCKQGIQIAQRMMALRDVRLTYA
jgi:predicted aldo/keto reductase-like oxidoreductase